MGLHRPAPGRSGRERRSRDGGSVPSTKLGAPVEHVQRRETLVRLHHETSRRRPEPGHCRCRRGRAPLGREADLANWHRAVDPVNRFGLVLFNSSGGPDWFAISGGAGRPSDIPRGVPAAVAMIHSFSAADPNDPQTIAGRWLSQGAFAYFGSVNEPFLLAFRPPGLVAELLAAEVPFVAALRQGELEAFGFPWRLVYLGDPLYRLQNAATRPIGPATQRRAFKQETAAASCRATGGSWRLITKIGQSSKSPHVSPGRINLRRPVCSIPRMIGSVGASMRRSGNWRAGRRSTLKTATA